MLGGSAGRVVAQGGIGAAVGNFAEKLDRSGYVLFFFVIPRLWFVPELLLFLRFFPLFVFVPFLFVYVLFVFFLFVRHGLLIASGILIRSFWNFGILRSRGIFQAQGHLQFVIVPKESLSLSREVPHPLITADQTTAHEKQETAEYLFLS
jgi:hypothetical protein